MPQDVDFFFDYLSPYTYLAFTQIPAIGERTGANFRFRPMHLLRLMQRVGNVPTTVTCANKLSYAMQDMGRWVARYGVPFRMNPHLFDADSTLPLKGALVARERGVEDAYHRAMFRAFWVDAANVNDRSRLEAALDAVGLGGKALLDAAARPEVGDLLEEHTESAAERKVFGAPTFAVGDELFFGNDRLEFLEEKLRG